MRVEERADSEPGREPETAEQRDDIASTSTGSTVFSLDLSACTKPYQPPPQCIEKQILSNKSLTFQEKWYQEYPWLHYSPSVKGVLCFYCSKGVSNQSSLGHRSDVQALEIGRKPLKNVQHTRPLMPTNIMWLSLHVSQTQSAPSYLVHGVNSRRWQDIAWGKLLALCGMWQGKDNL